MGLHAGSRLGPYAIEELLGSGGMGEVYRATDVRLGRAVAVKVLPTLGADDVQLRERLLREARAASRLNHPGIVAVHDVGEHEGTLYVVSELLEGETLRHLLQRGPLTAGRAAELARQIAEALAAAHAQGIVHRDLKPENLFVTRDRRVKILDFGLARLLAEPGRDEAPQGTTVEHATRPGDVLGTHGYMAPEQARGEPADARSDIFALGAVLHEMLSGDKAFGGDTPAETIAAVLRDEPRDLSSGRQGVPPHLARIAARCLEKEPARRFQAAQDVAFALEDAPAPARLARARGRVPLIAAALGLAAAVLAGLWAWELRREAPAPAFRRITHRKGAITEARFTSDGRSVVLSAAFGGEPRDVHVVSLEDDRMRSLHVGDAEVWGVSRNDELAIGLPIGDWRTLARVPLSGGDPTHVAKDCIGGDWMPDGSKLAMIRWPPGVQAPIGTEIYASSSDWLHSLRIHRDGSKACFIAHLGSRGTFAIVLADLAGGHRLIGEGRKTVGIAWSPEGDAILASQSRPARDTVLASYSLDGEERILWAGPGAFVLMDAAADGRLLVRHSHAVNGVRVLAGDGVRDVSSHVEAHVADISADGRWVLYSVYLREAVPLALLVRSDGSETRELGVGSPLAFSPDGQRVMLSSPHDGQIIVVNLDGTEERRAPAIHGPNSWGIVPVEWCPGDRLVTQDVTQAPIVRALDGGPTRRIGNDRLGSALVTSPDGSEAVGQTDQGMKRFSLDGAPPREVDGARAGDQPQRWMADGGLLVMEKTDLRRIVRIDLETGQRTVWRELGPWRHGEQRIHGASVSADGSVIAFDVEHISDELYVVSGLR